MASFLQLLAKDLLSKQPDLKDVTIIFPNKRAGLFLAKELSAASSNHIWMPEILTITEFMERQTGLKSADDLTLIIKLYKTFVKVSKSHETFDEFYYWGSMLLNDFNDIDKYQVDARSIFTNLKALQQIEKEMPWLSPEQIEIIQTFWRNFNPDKQSEEKKNFLDIWDFLLPIYQQFKESLAAQKLCYEGMGLRYFGEHIQDTPSSKHIVFAGFNALNESLKSIFSHYQSNGSGSFYWDYDIYYVSNPTHEAGRFMRENLKLFPNALPPEHFNNFIRNGKRLDYISVASPIGQTKLISTLLQKIPENEHLQTAIVLCDESLMLPTIHSIPDQVRKINITMGYPAKNTSIASLIFLLGELRKYAKKQKDTTYYYHKSVVALLNHPLIKASSQEEINQFILNIPKRKFVYIRYSELAFNDLCKQLFCNDLSGSVSYIKQILALLMTSKEVTMEATEHEFTFSIYTQLQILENRFKEEGIAPEERLYMQIIQKIITSTSIPFNGEPLEGMQIMGILETRLLDFKNLILLSVNEGMIPRGNQSSSFIPFTLRNGFKLPLPEFEDALYAYNFHRLLQRAKNITLMYVSINDKLNNGEMSRFMWQLKYESGLPITERCFQNTISTHKSEPLAIGQTETSLQKLKDLSSPESRGLSPSAINTLMACQIKFYFKYILNLKEKEEVAEEIDSRILGNIFHRSAELIYNSFNGAEITANDLDSLLKNPQRIEKAIETAIDEIFLEELKDLNQNGNNELVIEVAKKYLRRLFEYDKGYAPFKIVALEKSHSVSIGSVKIGGNIDRIDLKDNNIRVIDYKTGSDRMDFKSMESLFDATLKNRNKAAFQTLLYCLMFENSSSGNYALTPGIYSTQHLFLSDYDYHFRCAGTNITDFIAYKEEFVERLTQLLEHLFSTEMTFRQTENTDTCKNCSYKNICGI